MAAPMIFSRGLQFRHIVRQNHAEPISNYLANVLQVRHKGYDSSSTKKKGPRPRMIKEFPKGWEEKILSREVIDDVWYRKYYKTPEYTPAQAIEMHKEAAQPEMLDNMDALVYFDMVLNFRTNKQNKFQGDINKTVVLPHSFDDGKENRVLVFCRTPEEKEAALEAGAEYAGGAELVKSVENGDVRREDWEHLCCTMDFIPELSKIRKLLKDDFPNKTREQLGTDVVALTNHFVKGQTYMSVKFGDATGEMRVTLGRLSMSTEQLVDNFKAFIENISENQRKGSPGQFITQGQIVVPPSIEWFLIDSSHLLSTKKPDAPKKKKKPKVEPEEEQMVASQS